MKPMTTQTKPPCQWTDDCQGKKDYDGHVLSVSTRYWPRGGGFSIWDGARFEENAERPEIRPSAKSHLLLRHGNDDYEYLVDSPEFEGDTFKEVAAQVEAWVQEHYDRARSALLHEFQVKRA